MKIKTTHIFFFLLGILATAGLLLAKRTLHVSFDRTSTLLNQDTLRFQTASLETLRTMDPFFTHVSERDGTLTIPSGEYTLTKNIVFPKGRTVYIESGTRFFLAPNISFISYAPLTATDVEFRNADPTRPFGIVAIMSDQRTTLTSVIISGGNEAVIDNVRFTGALSIHGGEAMITDSVFTNAHGEDGINIRNASSTLTHSRITDNARDGLDFDASTARVTGNILTNNANDALDSSESSLEITQNRFAASIRCITATTNSHLTLDDNSFQECPTKLHIDDTSTLLLPTTTL